MFKAQKAAPSKCLSRLETAPPIKTDLEDRDQLLVLRHQMEHSTSGASDLIIGELAHLMQQK